MRVLLTGFEPFGGDTVNPSALAVAEIACDPLPGVSLRSRVLPVRYADAWPALLAEIAAATPELVLLTGLAGGRRGLSVERVAINLDDTAVPDNAGARRTETPVVCGGPAAYFATVPVQAMADACCGAGIEASVSVSAGTFLCNHVMYRVCHHAATQPLALQCGFVHLPWLSGQATRHVGWPSLELAAMVTGLRAMLAVAASAAGGAAGGRSS